MTHHSRSQVSICQLCIPLGCGLKPCTHNNWYDSSHTLYQASGCYQLKPITLKGILQGHSLTLVLKEPTNTYKHSLYGQIFLISNLILYLRWLLDTQWVKKVIFISFYGGRYIIIYKHGQDSISMECIELTSYRAFVVQYLSSCPTTHTQQPTMTFFILNRLSLVIYT